MPAQSYTERGFGEYAEFIDVYGAHVVVRQSSLATEDCVWIFAHGGGSIRPETPNREKTATSPHLNAGHARLVRDALTEWLRDVGAEGATPAVDAGQLLRSVHEELDGQAKWIGNEAEAAAYRNAAGIARRAVQRLDAAVGR